MHNSCVIQLEVFHINFHKNTLEGVIREAIDRVKERASTISRTNDTQTGIKTVIRFYDDNETVMVCLRKITEHKMNRESWINASRGNWLTNSWARWRIGKIQKKIDRELENIRSFAQMQLKRSRDDQTVVVLEKPDYDFRPIQHNEWYDLIQQISFGTMWIFTFMPTDLLQVNGLESAGIYMN
jgi:hypothetical protein